MFNQHTRLKKTMLANGINPLVVHTRTLLPLSIHSFLYNITVRRQCNNHRSSHKFFQLQNASNVQLLLQREELLIRHVGGRFFSWVQRKDTQAMREEKINEEKDENPKVCLFTNCRLRRVSPVYLTRTP